ncbi:MAG: DUF3800 domain-containing protein [Candidatus Kapabacteria bacterium]|nr:DUF3800 domain-containing protein [Candidatus Kapabacteria bacterium]
MTYSEYIVFVDESGDHGINNSDSSYSVFVLAFCVFRKDQYLSDVAPLLNDLKFRYFGHDCVVLHERDIRKRQGPFSSLYHNHRIEEFIADLNSICSAVPMRVIAVVIDKLRLKESSFQHENLYHIAMSQGLNLIDKLIPATVDTLTHIVFESRGKSEDAELELEFRRVAAQPYFADRSRFYDVVIADKKNNSAGLQLADLIARPIGIRVMRPDQRNRAYEVIHGKFNMSEDGQVDGVGLIILPKNKRPR